MLVGSCSQLLLRSSLHYSSCFPFLNTEWHAIDQFLQASEFSRETNGFQDLICCSTTDAVWNLWLASVITGAFRLTSQNACILSGKASAPGSIEASSGGWMLDTPSGWIPVMLSIHKPFPRLCLFIWGNTPDWSVSTAHFWNWQSIWVPRVAIQELLMRGSAQLCCRCCCWFAGNTVPHQSGDCNSPPGQQSALLPPLSQLSQWSSNGPKIWSFLRGFFKWIASPPGQGFHITP